MLIFKLTYSSLDTLNIPGEFLVIFHYLVCQPLSMSLFALPIAFLSVFLHYLYSRKDWIYLDNLNVIHTSLLDSLVTILNTFHRSEQPNVATYSLHFLTNPFKFLIISVLNVLNEKDPGLWNIASFNHFILKDDITLTLTEYYWYPVWRISASLLLQKLWQPTRQEQYQQFPLVTSSHF